MEHINVSQVKSASISRICLSTGSKNIINSESARHLYIADADTFIPYTVHVMIRNLKLIHLALNYLPILLNVVILCKP